MELRSILILQGFKPTKNVNADSHSSWSMTDKEINPSPEGADLNLQRFKMRGCLVYIYIYIYNERKGHNRRKKKV